MAIKITIPLPMMVLYNLFTMAFTENKTLRTQLKEKNLYAIDTPINGIYIQRIAYRYKRNALKSKRETEIIIKRKLLTYNY